ncbi:MAG TPA: protein TolR [Hyphomonadaceae bacterium]|jgi:biopolymer transport protein TolR
MAMMIRNGSGGGRRGRRKPMADINVTPMVDVMLVLLVVFMITAPMLATGVAVNLPKTRAEQMPTENERPLVVTVDKAGKIFVGMQDQPVEAATLGATLQAIAKDRLDKRVYVRADEGVNYGRVMEVLSLLQGAGFTQVGLPVDPQAKNRLQEGG